MKLFKYRLEFTHPLWPTETFNVEAMDYPEALTAFKNALLEDSGVMLHILKDGKIKLISKENI